MKLNIDVVPKDLDSAVSLIKEALESSDLEYIKSNDNSMALHHGFGTWLRNNWSLWSIDTPLVQWFINEYQLGFADDLSGLILDALWCDIQGKPRNTDVLINRYQNHWRRLGLNPVTMKKESV